MGTNDVCNDDLAMFTAPASTTLEVQYDTKVQVSEPFENHPRDVCFFLTAKPKKVPPHHQGLVQFLKPKMSESKSESKKNNLKDCPEAFSDTDPTTRPHLPPIQSVRLAGDRRLCRPNPGPSKAYKTKQTTQDLRKENKPAEDETETFQTSLRLSGSQSDADMTEIDV